MFCQNCGAEGAAGSFCCNCGTKIGEGVPSGASNVAINNLRDNPNIVLTNSMGCFEVFEYQKDFSVNPATATTSYFMQQMNFKKRQVLCNLKGNSVKLQGGAMQWMAGKVAMDADIKGAGDFVGKFLKSAATNEPISKPIYRGNGYVMLEPTYKYILLEDVAEWGDGLVVEDGMFLACEETVKESVVARNNVSSAVLGGEGLFNLSLSGTGTAVLESTVPREELIEIVLDNDEVKLDGNMAIAWSKSLSFTVEKSTKSMFGSWVSGEGLVNVYRGTGKILMAPVVYGTLMHPGSSPKEATNSSSKGIIGSVASSLFDL